MAHLYMSLTCRRLLGLASGWRCCLNGQKMFPKWRVETLFLILGTVKPTLSLVGLTAAGGPGLQEMQVAKSWACWDSPSRIFCVLRCQNAEPWICKVGGWLVRQMECETALPLGHCQGLLPGKMRIDSRRTTSHFRHSGVFPSDVHSFWTC